MVRLRLTGVLPETAAGRRLVIAALIDSAGTGLFLSGSALFFTRAVGLSTGQVGIGLSIAAVAGLIFAVPLGALGDRVGARQVLIGLQLWRGVWFACYAFAGSFPAFLVIACLLAVADQSVPALNQAVVSAAVGGASRTATMALMRSVRNVAFAVGAGLGSAVIAVGSVTGFRATVVADALTFFAAALLLRRVTTVPASARPAAARGTPWQALASLRDARYGSVALLNGVLMLYISVLTIGLPLWTVKYTTAPRWVIGCAILINTVMSATLQVRASRGCDEVKRAARRMRDAGGVLAVCCGLLALAAHLPAWLAAAALLSAAVAQGCGELWQSGGGWGLSYELAPAQSQAVYLSVFGLGTTMQTIVGPVLLTSVVMVHGSAGWLVLAAVFAAAGMALPRAARAAQRRPALTGAGQPDRDPSPAGGKR